MYKFWIRLIILCVVFSACKKDEVIKTTPESGYPATVEILTDAKWNAANTEFQKMQPAEGLVLNHNGFVQGKVKLEMPDSLSGEFVRSTINWYLTQYPTFLGIENIGKIHLETDLKGILPGLIPLSQVSFHAYFLELGKMQVQLNWEEVKMDFNPHRFFLRQTKLNDQLFEGPTIYFEFDVVEQTFQLKGNWIKEAIKPRNEIYTKSDAIAKTWQYILENDGFDLWETKHSFEVSKVFILDEKETQTEIRECWHVVVDLGIYDFFHFYMDTQTGDVIRAYKKWKYYM